MSTAAGFCTGRAAIEEDRSNGTLLARLTVLEGDKEILEAEIARAPAATPLRLHPRLTDLYAEKLARLEEALDDPLIRNETAEISCGLIDKVMLTRREAEPGPDALLQGDLARILALCKGAAGKR